MGILKRLKKYLARKINKRAFYETANIQRLVQGWLTGTSHINEIQKADGPVLVARARDLARNNDVVRGFLLEADKNVIGPKGIQIQGAVKDPGGSSDERANQEIERGWNDWSKPGNCDLSGKSSFKEIQSQILVNFLRDGEAVVKEYQGGSYGKYGYQVQVLDAAQVDYNYSVPTKRINLGIESDDRGRPVKYYYNETTTVSGTTFHQALDANTIIHIFKVERPGQLRGCTWLASSGYRLKVMDGWEEASLVGARVAASQMGFFKKTDESSMGFQGDGKGKDGTNDSSGYMEMTSEPGVFRELPYGMDFQAFDPKQPSTTFPEFRTAAMKSIASGLGVSFTTLGNDLSDVNYSSARIGLLGDRDLWRCMQEFLSTHLLQRIFDKWLPMFLISGNTHLPISKVEKFNDVKWQPRGWAWVDPQKESKANETAWLLRTKPLADSCAEQGKNWKEVMAQIKLEQDEADRLGIILKENEQPQETGNSRQAIS